MSRLFSYTTYSVQYTEYIYIYIYILLHVDPSHNSPPLASLRRVCSVLDNCPTCSGSICSNNSSSPMMLVSPSSQTTIMGRVLWEANRRAYVRPTIFWSGLRSYLQQLFSTTVRLSTTARAVLYNSCLQQHSCTYNSTCCLQRRARRWILVFASSAVEPLLWQCFSYER